MTVLNRVKIDTELFKSISKIAKRENTTEDKIINEILEWGIEKKEKIEDEYDCEALSKELNGISTEMDEGKYVELTIEELRERIEGASLE